LRLSVRRRRRARRQPARRAARPDAHGGDGRALARAHRALELRRGPRRPARRARRLGARARRRGGAGMSGAATNTVLVTAGAGYAASHTAKALAAAGYQPVTLDNLSRGFAHAVKWGALELGDILDRGFLDAVMTRWQPAAVLHFAALAYVGESVSDPARYWRNNVAGTLTLLEAMRDHGVGRIVFSSTCATYGLPVRLPLAEDHPQAPISPYGATK